MGDFTLPPFTTQNIRAKFTAVNTPSLPPSPLPHPAPMAIPHRVPMIIQSPILSSLHPQLHPETNEIASGGFLPGKKIFYLFTQNIIPTPVGAFWTGAF
jgi:hypothetical protein